MAGDHEWWTFEGVTRFLGDGPQQGVEPMVPTLAAAFNDEDAAAPVAAE
jgi:hypothetical protein